VTDENDGQRKSERNAQQLCGRQAEGAALIDRPQREQEMHQGCAVEQDGARQAVPDLDCVLEAFLGRRERDEAKRVIDEMGADVGEENEARGHPQVSPQRAR